MAVEHEVTSACGKRITVQGRPLSSYSSIEQWIKAHESVLKVGFSAIGAAAAVATHVKMKPPKGHL